MIIHVLTPGDHFSPRTGSAIPTVVDGLARAATADGAPRQAVLVDDATYPERYPSADVIPYTGAGYPSIAARATDSMLARMGMPRRSAQRAYRPIADTLAGRAPSIVVAHNAPALPAMLRDQPHRVVLYAHNDILRTATRPELDGLADVSAIVCVSRNLAERTAARLPAELGARVHVVPNGVDTVFFSPADAAPEDRPLRVVFIGRVVPDKGADVLVAAASALGRDDVEFRIVGSQGFDASAEPSRYERRLRDAAEGARAHIAFEPFVPRDRLPAILRGADVFVAPSRWAEPSGLTVGEAMATGLPIVTTRAGGIPEVIGDAGILVAPGSADELASALRRLIEDSELRRTLGIAARDRALEHDWTHSWRELSAVLMRVH